MEDSMKQHQSMNVMFELNEDELFYKDLYIAKQSPNSLKQFLSKIDKKDAIQRHLVIPELLPEIISYEMSDNEYFKEEDERNVFITKHNRYTPAFLHKHDFFEIIFVFSGHCQQYIDLERKEFVEGDLIFIAPSVFHTMEVFDDESLIFNILLRKKTFYQMFTPIMNGHGLISEFFSEGLYNSQQIKHLIFHLGEKELISSQQFMMKLYKEQIYHDDFSDQILIGMLTYFIARIMRDYKDLVESSYREHNKNQVDFKVMSYIQENIATVTLEDIAHYFGFSTAYCSRLIKTNTGQNFNKWKRIIRIRQAENMLQNTTMSITDISASLGYENPETFIRAFKKERFMTPAKYRKQKQG